MLEFLLIAERLSRRTAGQNLGTKGGAFTPSVKTDDGKEDGGGGPESQ